VGHHHQQDNSSDTLLGSCLTLKGHIQSLLMIQHCICFQEHLSLESRQTFVQKLVLTLYLLLIAFLLAIVCSLMYLLTHLMQIIGKDNGTEDYQSLSTSWEKQRELWSRGD
jgi:hypothetical protein